MITTINLASWISSNALWIGLGIIVVILFFKLLEYWNKNKEYVLNKVKVIQDKYKLPKQRGEDVERS